MAKVTRYANANITLFTPEAVNIPADRLAWKKLDKNTGKPVVKYGFRVPPETVVDISKLSDAAADRLCAGAKTPQAPALIETKPESPGRTLVFVGGKIKPVKLEKDALEHLRKGAK